MRTATTHEYHGITLRDDSYGWTIQIRLNGRYHFIKTFASDATTAARRHDVAINKLRAFIEEGTTPNFPSDFPPEIISQSDAPADYNKFRTELTGVFNKLINELESIGVNYDERLDSRENVFAESMRRIAAANRAERDQIIAALHRITNRLTRVSDLTPEQRKSVGANLEVIRKTLV